MHSDDTALVDRPGTLPMPSWRHLPRHTRRIELILCAVAALAAFAGCFLVQAGDDTEIEGLLLYYGALLLVAPAAAFNRCVSRRGGVTASLRSVVAANGGAPVVQGLRELGAPGLAVWLLPLVVLPLNLLTIPVGAAADSLGDPGETAFELAVFSPVIPLIGLLVWILVLLQVLVLLVTGLRVLTGGRHRSEVDAHENRLVSSAAGLLLSVILFATSLVLGAPDLDSPTRHGAQAQQLLALLGLNPSIVEHPVLLWIARLALVGIVLSGVVLTRSSRAARRER